MNQRHDDASLASVIGEFSRPDEKTTRGAGHEPMERVGIQKPVPSDHFAGFPAGR